MFVKDTVPPVIVTFPPSEFKIAWLELPPVTVPPEIFMVPPGFLIVSEKDEETEPPEIVNELPLLLEIALLDRE